LLHDLRFALRVRLKSRAFTAVVVVTMALGIGVNTTIFTIVTAVVFKGMPFDNPGEIAFLSSNRGGMSYPDLVDFREQARSFKGLGAFVNVPADLSDGDTEAERVTGARITANTFSLLGTQPLLGRDFASADEQRGAHLDPHGARSEPLARRTVVLVGHLASVRMALGAGRRDILWLVLRHGITRISLGLALGVVAAVGMSRVLSSVLVNTSATDVPTFVAICILLVAVTLLACFVPARRATRADPVDALRTE
jgi:hypothetical protein